MDLHERLALLVESGQIRPAAAAAAEQLLAGVAAYIGRPVDADTGAMIATHVALALERLLAGEALADVPDVVIAEAKAYPETWAAAARLFAEALGEGAGAAEGADVVAPASEIAYLTLHLQTLRQAESTNG
jgi:hypothetical protein